MTALDGHVSDDTLVARMAQGDAAALESLYDRYAPLVLGIALRILRDNAAAETVLQETFWRVWQKAATDPPGTGSFSGGLFQIARHLAREAASATKLRQAKVCLSENRPSMGRNLDKK